MGTALSVPWGTEVDQTSDAFLDRIQSEKTLRMVDSRSAVLQVPAAAMPAPESILPKASALP
ncbi:hypothetical protein D3C87_2155730 [compost metagenome]